MSRSGWRAQNAMSNAGMSGSRGSGEQAERQRVAEHGDADRRVERARTANEDTTAGYEAPGMLFFASTTFTASPAAPGRSR